MNIALIGSGGREHALCQKIHESTLSKNIICIQIITAHYKYVIKTFHQFIKLIKFSKWNIKTVTLKYEDFNYIFLVKFYTDFC